MSQCLLIERINVQNANAVSGFTWGFPAITHFLGFTHNLERKLINNESFNRIALSGCVVVAHEQTVLTYKESSNTRFSQYKTAQYLGLKFDKGILKDPAINEEAKMNMTVSLLIPVAGYLEGLEEEFIDFIKNACQLQRLAGGTILDIHHLQLINLTDDNALRRMRNNLLPGFVLQDRSSYLEDHFLNLQKTNPQVELLDAWFDFIALKQAARPICDLIDKYFSNRADDEPQLSTLNELWLEHKDESYQSDSIPAELVDYFAEHHEELDSKLLEQWQDYINPNEKVSANWEYVKKPESGFLVPIMTGYKAITELFPAGEIEGARDVETDVCFVESVHSIGEWQSVHRLKKEKEWQASVWRYAPFEQDWYLCKQFTEEKKIEEVLDDNFDPYA